MDGLTGLIHKGNNMPQKVKKEHESRYGGNPLVIDLEVNDAIIQIEIICPICNHTKSWLSEDYSILYCSKCRTVLGKRYGDFTMKNQIQWKV